MKIIKQVLFRCVVIVCLIAVFFGGARLREQERIMFDQNSANIVQMFPEEIRAIEAVMGKRIEIINREVVSVIRDMVLIKNTTDQYQELCLEELLNRISLAIAEYKDAKGYSEFP